MPDPPENDAQSPNVNQPSARSGWITGLRSERAVPVVVALIGMVAAVFAAFISSFTGRDLNRGSQLGDLQLREQQEIVRRAQNAAETARSEIAVLVEQNKALQAAIAKAASDHRLPSFSILNPADRQTLDDIKSSQNQLQTRLAALETSLLNTPEKALSVPLLKQQVDSLQDRAHNDLDAVRGEIGRLY